MPAVVMYTREWCPFCVMAKRLLARKGVVPEERNVETEPALLSEMLERSGGRRTVPQIFVGERHVGGYQELAAMERAGELDLLLSASS